MCNFIPKNTQNVEDIDDILFEAMLRQAVIKNHFDEMAAMPSEEELSKIYTFSDEHNKKMKKIFAADRRREVFSVIIKWSKAAAIAACACFTLTFGLLLTSAEVRNAIGNVVITWFDQFTKFESESLSDGFVERDWQLQYIPDGFVLQEIIDLGSLKSFIYSDENNKRLDFTYRTSDSSTSVDNDDREYRKIIENGVTYHLFISTKDDNSDDEIIVWDMDEYRFTVIGNLEIDELMKVALSVN